MNTRVPAPALPKDVPAHVVPIGAPAAWLVAVALVGYRCQCAGLCGARHKPRPEDEGGPRCAKQLRGRAAVRLFLGPAGLVLCAGCLDAITATDRRAAKTADQARAAGAPSLFDLLTD